MAYVFLDDSYTGDSASSGSALTGYDLDFGSVLYGQERDIEFKIGNTGTGAVDVTLSCTGVNADLYNGVTFSDNGDTFSSTLSVSLDADGVSDTLYARAEYDTDVNIGTGTVLFDIS